MATKKKPALGVTPAPPKAPDWWKPLKGTTYDAAANALIPYLAPENQRAVGSYLAGSNAKAFGSYASVSPLSTPANSEARQYYMSSARAQDAMNSLANSGVTKGAGATYLNSVLTAMQRLGGQGGQITRANYQELVNAVAAIDAQNKGNSQVAPFMALTKYLLNPTVSTGGNPLPGVQQSASGRTIYGTPNSSLYD